MKGVLDVGRRARRTEQPLSVRVVLGEQEFGIALAGQVIAPETFVLGEHLHRLARGLQRAQ